MAADDDDCVEITLELREEEQEDTKQALSAKGTVMPGRLEVQPWPDQSCGLTKASMRGHALKGLKFIRKADPGWAMVERRFIWLTATTNGLLPRRDLQACIGGPRLWEWESKEFNFYLFDALARKRNISSDSITKEQLKEFWDLISDRNPESQLQALFNILDINGDGRITKEEVKEILVLSASANKLSNIKDEADLYAELLMQECDPNNLGYIVIRDLENVLRKGNKELDLGVMPMHGNHVKQWYRDLLYFLVDNSQKVWVIALWIGAMASLFIFKYVQYMNRPVYDVMGHCVCFAVGAAETLKLNMAIVLLPVCRNTITWLRNNTKLNDLLPLDDNIHFHKVISVAVALGTAIHGISHLTCGFPRVLKVSQEKYKPMATFFGHQKSSYWKFLAGWQGITGLIMIVIMVVAFTLASSWFRKSKVNLPRPLNKLIGFNSFWYSHHLFIIVYMCLIIHGTMLYPMHEWYKKTTWMYLAIPMALYAGERFIRIYRSNILEVRILKVAIYPGNVMALHMSKPPGFTYKSGQYIFLNCAAVSRLEWHPFCLTSAPGSDYLSVYIRTVGDWTRKSKTVFSEICQPSPTEKDELLSWNKNLGEQYSEVSLPKLQIDGPYGAPTQHYKDYDVVLLVGMGIGCTPIISVIQDIVNNMNTIDDEEERALEEGISPNTGFEGGPNQKMTSKGGRHNFKTKKAYFCWVTREQSSFNWFKNVMNDVVAKMDNKGVIEMHNYLTAVHEEGHLYSSLISMLQSFYYVKTGIDIISGTHFMSHFGRPDWHTIYTRIAIEHPNTRVGIFYCGPWPLQKELRNLASDFSHKTNTKFEFHNENF